MKDVSINLKSVVSVQKSILAISIFFLFVSCATNIKTTRAINTAYRIKYPEINSFARTTYQEKHRKRVLSKLSGDLKYDNSKIYLVEILSNRGGHHILLNKRQSLETYIWGTRQMLEHIIIGDDNKIVKIKGDLQDFWSISPTLSLIENLLIHKELDSLKKLSKHQEYYINHSGEMFITELNAHLEITQLLKCDEFYIIPENTELK